MQLIFLWLFLTFGACSGELTITATTPAVWNSWANITVSWSNNNNNNSNNNNNQDEWVGAFLVDYNATYIKFHNVSSEESSTVFHLLNGRHPYHFHYFRKNEILATSNIIHPNASFPNQAHLSFVPQKPDQMSITWTTSDANPGKVMYGLTAGDLGTTAIATVDTYKADDFTTCMNISAIPPRTTPFDDLSSRSIRCGTLFTEKCYDDPTSSEMYLHPGYIHTALMKNLQSGTRYHYNFGSDFVYSFVSPRSKEAEESFTFLVTGDMGVGGIHKGEAGGATDNDRINKPTITPNYPNGIDNGADTVVRQGILFDPETKDDEFILVNGDISYARGWPWIWEKYFDLVQPLATKMPMMVSVGNHEVDSHENPFVETSGGDSGGECGVTATKRFPTQLLSTQKMYYSFTHGSIHVIVLSTEHPVDEQVTFLKQDVAALNRGITPWLLVSMHRPIFISEFTPPELTKILRTTWHPLFVESGVDFVYTGHAHYYERLCAVEMAPNNFMDLSCSTSRDRPVYIVDGSAGAEPDLSILNVTKGLTLYKEFGRWGYSRVVVNSEYLEMKHYSAKIGSDGMSVELPYVMTDSIRLPKIKKYPYRFP